MILFIILIAVLKLSKVLNLAYKLLRPKEENNEIKKTDRHWAKKNIWVREVKKEVHNYQQYDILVMIRVVIMSNQKFKIPVIGLNRRKTEDGLLISARNLYKSSSLRRSPS